MTGDLGRRALGEAVGTMLLLVAVVGSGIAAERLIPGEPGLQLAVSAMATGCALVAVIFAIGPVSGAHLNPVVTLASRSPDALAYVAAQVAGAASGTVLANLMFSEPAVAVSVTRRAGPGLWLAEVVATFGLVLVVLGVKSAVAPFAVGAYITGAYVFTASTSFANPAATLARTLTGTFAGIAPASVPVFLAGQALGALLGAVVAAVLFPRPKPSSEVVVPHERAA